MRITKNDDNVSPLVYVISCLEPNATSHPSSLYQVDRDDSFSGNGSVDNSIEAAHCLVSMKLSCNNEEATSKISAPESVYPDKPAEPHRPARLRKAASNADYIYYDDETPLGSKKRGKRREEFKYVEEDEEDNGDNGKKRKPKKAKTLKSLM